MTLGPKFYIFSVLSPRICFCFANAYFLAGSTAFFEILLLAVSKHGLKRSKKSWIFDPDRLFGPGLLFSWTFAPGGRLSDEAYNVFTLLIYVYITFTFIFINLYLHLHLPLYLLIYIYIYITFLIYIYIYITFTFILLFFMHFLQNVIWLNTRTGLRYKRHILHAPKYA